MTSAKFYIYIGVGTIDLYIDKAYTALDIFRFAVFFFSNFWRPDQQKGIKAPSWSLKNTGSKKITKRLNQVPVAQWYDTGCFKKKYQLLFCSFLGFQNILKSGSVHVSIAQSLHNPKITIFLI